LLELGENLRVEFFQSLNQIIFPTRCISCRQLGEILCNHCKTSWTPSAYYRKLPGSPGLSLYSAIEYSDVAARVILAAKESQIKSADYLVANAINHSLCQWLKTDWVDTLIPIPSRRSAARKRGRQFMEEIAHMVSRTSGISVASPLQHSRLVRDQSGLGYEQRRNNLYGALVVTGNPEGLGRALLVDDLVTTGATLNEAARALRYAGIEVIGAVTAAIAQTVR
jgi:predicted amidophosphoribosyltransferase